MLGYRTLSEKGKKDPFLALRAEQVRARGQELRLLIPTLSHFAHNRLERERVAELSRELTQTFGKETAKMKALQAGALALARAQAWKADIFGDLDQPETHLTQYRWGKAGEVVEAIAEALQPGARDPAVG